MLPFFVHKARVKIRSKTNAKIKPAECESRTRFEALGGSVFARSVPKPGTWRVAYSLTKRTIKNPTTPLSRAVM